MRILKRVAIGLGLTFVVAILLFLTFVVGWRALIQGPRARAASAAPFERTPERVERGRHLVEEVYGCAGCHSERDFTKPGGPAREGRRYAGVNWGSEGMPWMSAPNLTPDPETGAGSWTDDQMARAIREGIGHDGRALFPIMPYQSYRRIPDDDVKAIVAYLRTVPAVKNALPPTKMPFPMNLIMRKVPQPLEGPVAPPDLSTPEKRGEFLVNTIDCGGCHTAKHHGEPLPGLALGGGFPLEGGSLKAVSTNLTPDPSGIPHYDESLFIELMRTGKVRAREVSPIMPWVFFSKMSDDDLKAMFAYLKTVPPVKHRVNNTDPPTDCKRCGTKHGLGEQNVAAAK